jgi:hypothetical protein
VSATATKRDVFTLVVRIALAIGFLIDFYVGLLALFAPQLLTPLLDLPMRDPLLAQLAGPEFVVAALVYAVAFRDPARYRVLLWLCALDQAFAVVMPTLALAHGAVPASWKIVAPIPLQALMAIVFAVYAARPGRNRSATPFMQ